MRAIDIHLKQAEENAQEWVEYLATCSGKRLQKRLRIVRKQLVIAEQNKDEKSFELMLHWEHITICAIMYKEEHNIADITDELEKSLKDIETVVVLSEKRQQAFKNSVKTKQIKTAEGNESENQLSLF